MKNVLSHLLITVTAGMRPIHKAFCYGVNMALNGLKDLTDPARQGNPYDLGVTYEMPSSKRRLSFLRRRMNWRI